MSFLSIMKEQQLEQHRNINNHHRVVVMNEDDDFEKQMKLALELSMTEAKANELKHEDDNDHGDLITELTAQQQQNQLEEDEQLAMLLQQSENDSVVDINQLSLLQKEIYSFNFEECEEGDDDDSTYDDNDNDDDSDCEYDYTEPNQLEGGPIIYDKAQRDEDKDIAFITKRDKLKRVNALPVAAHHKTYHTRNKGKNMDHDETIKTSKPKKKKAENLELQRKGEIFDYGFVSKWLGGGMGTVHCWSGKTRLCRTMGTLRKKCPYPSNGSFVALRIHDQISKAQIAYTLTDQELTELFNKGVITAVDMVQTIDIEIQCVILSLLSPIELHLCGLVSQAWRAMCEVKKTKQ